MGNGKKLHKWTAIWIAVTFAWMTIGLISPEQLKAETAKAKSRASAIEGAKNNNSKDSSFEKEGGTKEIAKKKKFPWLWVAAGAIVVGVIVYFAFIKKPKKILNVDLGTGVTGTPAAGKYTYKKGDKVTYNFTCADGYKSLSVLLDGKPAAGSGTIVMDKAHTFVVTVTQLRDFTLTVSSIDYGITGTPIVGYYPYREDTVVPYQYSLGDLVLLVMLDDVELPQSGSLVMDKNHVLKVSVKFPPDIRGTWRLHMIGDKDTLPIHQFNVSFSGTQSSGVFDVGSGVPGQYQVSLNQVLMEINMGHEAHYSFSGFFSSDNVLSGIYKYADMDYGMFNGSGTWTATRIE